MLSNSTLIVLGSSSSPLPPPPSLSPLKKSPLLLGHEKSWQAKSKRFGMGCIRLISSFVIGCSLHSCTTAFVLPIRFDSTCQQRAVCHGNRPLHARRPDLSRVSLHSHGDDAKESVKSLYKHPNFDEPFELDARPPIFDEVASFLLFTS